MLLPGKTQAQLLFNKLNTPKRTVTGLRFPSDIDTDGTGNIIRFKIALPEGSKYLSNGKYKKAIDPRTGNASTTEYRSPNARGSIARRFSSNYVMTTTTIDLYMPPQVQSSYATEWASTELGAAGMAVDAALGLYNSNGFGDAWGKISNYFSDNAGFGVMNTAAGTVQALTPLNAKDTLAVITSTTENPYMEVLFKGVSNRTFQFTFKMIPRNAKEQQIVRDIVKEFKFHRAPEFKSDSNNAFMLFPSEFDIEFIHRSNENPWIFKISTCALTNVSINHSPEGSYASHADGSPFATEMTLEFTELAIMTKENMLMGY